MKAQQLIQNLHLGKNGQCVCECNLFEGVEEGLKNGSCKGMGGEKKKRGWLGNAEGERDELYRLG